MRRTQTRPLPGSEEIEFPKILESAEDVATLRRILQEILRGPAFKGSQRSAQFLEFVVEQSIAGNFDQLKERLIGVRLFHRPATYDSGEDAIVRVTASDVRKRLLQHYGWFGTGSEFCIDLPLGTYVPRISRRSQVEHTSGDETAGKPELLPIKVAPPTTGFASLPLPATQKTPTRLVLWFAIGLAGLIAAAGLWVRAQHRPAPVSAALAGLPWSALFTPAASTHLITSDPNIDIVQGITKTNLSLSDYANHKYLPDPKTLTPEQLRFSRILLLADTSAASPDTPTTAKIAQIAQTFSKALTVQTARAFQVSYLNNGDNFIFLGSPRSNPWFSLFARELHFAFVYDPKIGSEFIQNLHPEKSEQATYIPSANGGGTGYSFAIIAFVRNPDQSGQVLLLAGADGEATAAAGDFVTDLPRLSRALQNCGIAQAAPMKHFEILLRTETMAGVPREADVMACHVLIDSLHG